MGYKYALHCFKGYVIHFKSITQPPEAYSAVYKYSAFFSSDKRGIALAGAEKWIESCHWIFSVPFI
jgi:hypothetical protein